jgi:DNA-binding NtrC family response regulator
MSNILVVDDVKRDQEMLAGPFRSAHEVRCVGDLNEANNLLDKWWPDVALVDAIFPKIRYAPPSFQAGSLLDLIEGKSTSDVRRPQIIILSGQNDTAKKFDEIRSWLDDGRVADVIAKATADMGVKFFESVVQLRVENLLERRKWRSVQASAESDSEWFRRLGIITRSPKMLALRRDLEATARSNACVLLVGERGAGKTSLAEAIQAITGPDKPFIMLDSANISAELFESELFGIEGKEGHPQFPKKTGLLELAADGIFFLDNIHNLSGYHQRKLNMVLQERKFLKVNGKSEIPFRARFITAANEDLKALVEQGTFRRELYDRLDVFCIRVPKLSERAEDIPDLVESFLEAYVSKRRSKGFSCPKMRLQPKCVDMLCAYEWPGNVRQLENLVEKVAAFAADDQKKEVEINQEMLLEREPDLGKTVRPGSAFDLLLRDAGIGTGQWADLTETQACESIRRILSDSAKLQFDQMLCALEKRPRGAAPGSPGRDDQDPATVHCLKVLLYLLLCPEHRISIQQIQELLQMVFATGKKIMDVLAANRELIPSFSPFLRLPKAGTRQIAELMPGII